MRLKFIPLIAAVGAIALALTTVTVGLADLTGKGAIIGSDHDVGTEIPVCANCHIPHDAKGLYLWAQEITHPDLPGSAPLCFSCHDGAVTETGTYIMDPETVNHRMGPDEGHGAMARYGTDGGYCSACHDAHDPTWRFTKAVMREGKPPNPYNAQVCLSCHGEPYFNPDVDVNHPWEVTMTNPPPPVDMTFNPVLPEGGTRLWDSATLQEPVPQGSDGDITCLTCHAVHGALGSVEVKDGPTNTLNSMAYKEADSTSSPLCFNCHE